MLVVLLLAVRVFLLVKNVYATVRIAFTCILTAAKTCFLQNYPVKQRKYLQ